MASKQRIALNGCPVECVAQDWNSTIKPIEEMHYVGQPIRFNRCDGIVGYYEYKRFIPDADEPDHIVEG